jgi:NAD(P)-dependent dehydrogenase (short-subunit alcohol dehydrogenase family)
MSHIAVSWHHTLTRKGFPITKTYFITGASSGFGRLLTEKLLARGDRVAATVRQEHILDDLKAQHSDRLWIANLDLTHTDAVRGVIDRAFADLGCIDIVVSNAGYGLFGAAEEVSDEQVRHQIDTNLIGSIAVIRASLPHLRAQGGGRVLQVSSEGGQITYPGFSLYHATKWGIEGFVEAVAKEVARFGILFTLVEPGPTGTNFGAGLVRAQPMEVYEGTPVGGIRDVWAKGEFKVTGDADKMVDAMITASDSSDPPLRLTLGSIAYVSIHKALNDRLAVLEGSKTITLSTDVDR